MVRKTNVMILHAPIDVAGAEMVILNMNRFIDSSRINLHNCPFINFTRGKHRYIDALAERGVHSTSIPLVRRFERRYIVETQRLIYEKKIDIVHSHGWRSDVTAYLATRGTGIPLVSTIHGWTSSRKLGKIGFYETIQKIVLKKMNILIAVSQMIEEGLLRIGIPGERIVCIGNVIDVASLPQPDVHSIRKNIDVMDGVPLLVYTGRLSPEKGVDTLIACCNLLKYNNIRFHLAIVGDGRMRREYETMTVNQGLNEHITFLGYRRDAREIIGSADLFVLPSRTEGIPIVLLEAMGYRRPIVASRVGGIPEMIEQGKNGMLVPPDDATELAKTITELLRKPEEARRIGECGYRLAKEKMDSNTWARKIESVYFKVLGWSDN